jgi:hypothetical protein
MLTEGEYRAVAARASAAGLTVPSYLALTGLRPEGVAAGDAKAALINARGARRVLSGVGNNLNQLTAKLHSTGEVDSALPVVVAAVHRVASLRSVSWCPKRLRAIRYGERPAAMSGVARSAFVLNQSGRNRDQHADTDQRPEQRPTPRETVNASV